MKMEIETQPKREYVSTVYLIRDNKVLLTLNEKINKWVPIGGHIKENELPHEAAIREAKEETGFDIKLIKTNKETGNINQNFSINLDIIKPDHHHINLGYIAEIISGFQESDKTDDNTELKWFSKEEISDLENIPENVKLSSIKAIELLEKCQK